MKSKKKGPERSTRGAVRHAAHSAFAVVAIAFGGSACIDTGTEPVAIPLSVAGTRADAPFMGRGGWTVQLERADLVFGPLTLCAGATAGALCETAHAEWLDSARVDTLDPQSRSVGEVIGIGGTVRSWMYELGFVSILTADESFATPAVRELGSSARLTGTATQGSRVVHFDAQVDVQQDPATERGVPVVSKNRDDRFNRELSEPGLELLVRFDPRPWLADVNFEDAIGASDCTDTCELQFTENTQAYRALRLALEAGAPPKFIWRSD
jgi:hypothetical protein